MAPKRSTKYVSTAAALLLAFIPVAAQADDLTFFHTPSGNIHCLGVDENGSALIDCEIISITRSTLAMPRPGDCDLDWGSRFELGETGGAYLACAGDTVRDGTGQTLAYGKTFRLRSITCTSTQKGLDCRNAEGQGFFLSKAEQRLY